LKKLYLIIIFSLPLLSEGFLNLFNSKSNGKSFLALGIVQQNTNNYRNSQALNLSYSFTHKNKFGFEFGYVQSLGDAKHKRLNKETDFSSISLLSTYLIPFDSHIGLKSKMGYAKNKHAEDGFSYGTELIFQVGKNSGLSVAYHQMNHSMKYIMINSVYKLKH
jgi:hypothetical protein